MAMYGDLKYWPSWVQTLVNINHFALVVNSSINILIYACKDEKFLNVLLITIRYKRNLSRSESVNVELPTRVEAPSTPHTMHTRIEKSSGGGGGGGGGGGETEAFGMTVMDELESGGSSASADNGGNCSKTATANNGYCTTPKKMIVEELTSLLAEKQ
jgi:hypothetical protein